MGLTQQIASLSIVRGVAVLMLKMGARWLTGSAAPFADALETLINVPAAVIALVALRFAHRPAETKHTYRSRRRPGLIVSPLGGLAFTKIATLLNAGWAVVLPPKAKPGRSAALSADGRHPRMDVATSIAVITGVSLAVWTSQMLIDIAPAAMVAVHVLRSGLRLVSESVGGLMDAAPTTEITDRIHQLVEEHAYDALEMHDLPTRHAGRLTYLERHLVVPGELTVSGAHAIWDRIEATLRVYMNHRVFTIGLEPEAKAKQPGGLVP